MFRSRSTPAGYGSEAHGGCEADRVQAFHRWDERRTYVSVRRWTVTVGVVELDSTATTTSLPSKAASTVVPRWFTGMQGAGPNGYSHVHDSAAVEDTHTVERGPGPGMEPQLSYRP
jgi:hypothetical protein